MQQWSIEPRPNQQSWLDGNWSTRRFHGWGQDGLYLTFWPTEIPQIWVISPGYGWFCVLERCDLKEVRLGPTGCLPGGR